MDRRLLGATLLLASGFATQAMADAPEISISGFVNFEAWGSSQDDRADRNRGYQFYVDESELEFAASATADNGLEYSATILYDMAGSSTKEAYLTFVDDWGTVQLGNTGGVEDAFSIGGKSVLVGAGGFDGDMFDRMFNDMGADVTSPDIAGKTDEATKISYFTPDFSGLQAGISFTPDSGHYFDAAYSDADDGETSNNIAGGITYGGSAGDVEFAVAATGVIADTETNPYTVEDTRSFALGGTLSYAGFTLGADYGDNGDSGETKGGNTDAGQYYSVGLGYETGPYSFDVAYFHGWSDEGPSVADDEVDFLTLGANYAVADGLAIYAEFDHIDIDQDGTANDNSGEVYILGTQVSF